MLKRDFKGWRVGGVLLALACLSATASAQGPVPAPAIPGMAADGSITADGVTFTAEDIQAMIDSYRVNPAGLPADLPSTVRAAVYTLAAGHVPPPPPPPPAGGAQ